MWGVLTEPNGHYIILALLTQMFSCLQGPQGPQGHPGPRVSINHF